MRNIVFAALAAAPLFAVPAFAQSGNTQPNTEAQKSNNIAAQNPAQIRQKIASELEQSGFTNVHVVPNSFLVHAVNKQGDPMVMIIDPDSVFSMTEMPNNNHTAKNNAAETGAAKTTQQ